jgi:hypothetical protein
MADKPPMEYALDYTLLNRPTDLLIRLAEAEATIKEMVEWLDNNTTHYETAEQDEPVLASVTKKIWYHATNDCKSYPFSEMMKKAIEATKEI